MSHSPSPINPLGRPRNPTPRDSSPRWGAETYKYPTVSDGIFGYGATAPSVIGNDRATAQLQGKKEKAHPLLAAFGI